MEAGVTQVEPSAEDIVPITCFGACDPSTPIVLLVAVMAVLIAGGLLARRWGDVFAVAAVALIVLISNGVGGESFLWPSFPPLDPIVFETEFWGTIAVGYVILSLLVGGVYGAKRALCWLLFRRRGARA